MANRADLLSMPMRITVPNLVLVSQFARFCLKMDFSCSTMGGGEGVGREGERGRGSGWVKVGGGGGGEVEQKHH